MNNVSIIPQNTLQVHGNLFRVHRPQSRKGGGRRGVVKEFSRQSQARFVEKMLTLDWARIAESYVVRFITLTTPPDYWERLPFVYSCLDTMRREFYQRGAVGSFVRRERGSLRGMLHYHLVVLIPVGSQGGWFPENPDLPEGWIGAKWRESLGYPYRVRVTSEIPQDWGNVQRYITKYCTKAGYEQVEKGPCTGLQGSAGEDACAGSLSKAHNAEDGETSNKDGHNGNRHWYIWGKERLPWAEPMTYFMGQRAIRWTYLVKRVFRKVIKQRLIKKYRRELLGERGKGLSGLELQAVFRAWCGAKGERHIARSVSKNSLFRYISRGWFSGWRLWCNDADLEILGRLMQLTERV